MSLRIAVFDDNKNIRESISMLLGTVAGFEVVALIPTYWIAWKTWRRAIPK